MTKPAQTSSRRLFCRRMLLGAGLGLTSAPARASVKMSKETAGYTLRDKQATQICGSCLYFNVPDECMIVEGEVSPYGWCLYYYD